MPLPPLTMNGRHQVRILYSILHDKGVLHNDVEARHILLTGREIRLVDFERSIERQATESDAEWRTRCDRELLTVNALFR